MPRYCYTTKTGQTVERYYKIGEAPEKVRVGRRMAYRDRRAEQVAVPSTAWPMEPCFASGVHPSQAQELRDYLKKAGVPTEVTRDGDPIYTSKEHRRRALKARGMYDKSSYD